MKPAKKPRMIMTGIPMVTTASTLLPQAKTARIRISFEYEVERIGEPPSLANVATLVRELFPMELERLRVERVEKAKRGERR